MFMPRGRKLSLVITLALSFFASASFADSSNIIELNPHSRPVRCEILFKTLTGQQIASEENANDTRRVEILNLHPDYKFIHETDRSDFRAQIAFFHRTTRDLYLTLNPIREQLMFDKISKDVADRLPAIARFVYTELNHIMFLSDDDTKSHIFILSPAERAQVLEDIYTLNELYQSRALHRALYHARSYADPDVISKVAAAAKNLKFFKLFRNEAILALKPEALLSPN